MNSVPLADNHNISDSQFNRPLDALMDNVIASHLGKVARDAGRYSGGDSIDDGLNLLRLLKESGFTVIANRPKPFGKTLMELAKEGRL